MMVPINLSDQKLEHLAKTFCCQKGSLPFTYLGLPLGVTKPKIKDFLLMVNRCEQRLASVSMFLFQAGRIELTNLVFSSMPTFFMCTLVLPPSVIKQIDKYRKHCLWRAAEANNRKPPKVSWELVCVPKDEGGLGVLDLKKQNEALMLKNLHKFFNDLDIPWVKLIWEKVYANGKLPSNRMRGGFWWRSNLKILQSYKSIAKVKVKNGSTCLLWEDSWSDEIVKLKSPELYSFAKNK
jgi:hypothetical protein